MHGKENHSDFIDIPHIQRICPHVLYPGSHLSVLAACTPDFHASEEIMSNGGAQADTLLLL